MAAAATEMAAGAGGDWEAAAAGKAADAQYIVASEMVDFVEMVVFAA